MYTITWKNGPSGELYRIMHDDDAENLPEPGYVYGKDLHPVFLYAITVYRLLAPGDFERISDNAFRLSRDQFNEFWEAIQHAKDAPASEHHPDWGTF